MPDTTAEFEVKHPGHSPQSVHGRRTARRRASQAEYRRARGEGADVATARQRAREAGIARQGERDARLSRMRERRAGAPEEDGIFGAEYRQRQADLARRPTRPNQAGPRSDEERATFLTGQARAGGMRTEELIRQADGSGMTPEQRARRDQWIRERMARQGGGGATRPPETPPPPVPARSRETAEVESATRRVKMGGAWDEPASDKQRSWLRELSAKAISGTKEGTAQRRVAEEIAARLPALTKWEASSLIDGLRRPKPITTMIEEAHASAKDRRERARSSEQGTKRTPRPGDALFALSDFQHSLIARILEEDAIAEGLPF